MRQVKFSLSTSLLCTDSIVVNCFSKVSKCQLFQLHYCISMSVRAIINERCYYKQSILLTCYKILISRQLYPQLVPSYLSVSPLIKYNNFQGITWLNKQRTCNKTIYVVIEDNLQAMSFY